MHYVAWTIFHHRSSYECGECKEGSVHLTLTLTTIFCRCQQTVQLPPVHKPIQLKQTTSPKMAKKFVKANYITTMYFVLCIVCCVSQSCVLPTIKCKFFQQIYLFFHKNNNLFCVNYYFFEWCRFLNVCMQCPVDMTESLVEPLRFWSYHSAGRIDPSSAGRCHPWACHAINHKNFIYQPIFTIFSAKNSAISRL